MKGFSRTHSTDAGFVTKCGEMNPRSNCMPSTILISVWMLFPSSTEIAPSLPTLENACASISPTAPSLPAARVPIWRRTFSSFTSRGSAAFLSASQTASAPRLIPRESAIGLPPEVTMRMPSRKIASARTAEVVVPSPAWSLVLDAASLIILAAMFSYGSLSSTSSQTETPSLVMVGAPQDLSMTTVRPRGPRVGRTASATFWTPLRRASRAACSKRICLGMDSLRQYELEGGSAKSVPHDPLPGRYNPLKAGLLVAARRGQVKGNVRVAERCPQMTPRSDARKSRKRIGRSWPAGAFLEVPVLDEEFLEGAFETRVGLKAA